LEYLLGIFCKGDKKNGFLFYNEGIAKERKYLKIVLKNGGA
jgi:hypothetical protein